MDALSHGSGGVIESNPARSTGIPRLPVLRSERLDKSELRQLRVKVPGTKMSGPATRGIHLGRSPEQSAYIVYDPATRHPRAAYPSLRTFALLRQNFPRIFRGPLRNEPAQAGPDEIFVPSATPVQGGLVCRGAIVTQCPLSLPPNTHPPPTPSGG